MLQHPVLMGYLDARQLQPKHVSLNVCATVAPLVSRPAVGHSARWIESATVFWEDFLFSSLFVENKISKSIQVNMSETMLILNLWQSGENDFLEPITFLWARKSKTSGESNRFWKNRRHLHASTYVLRLNVQHCLVSVRVWFVVNDTSIMKPHRDTYT